MATKEQLQKGAEVTSRLLATAEATMSQLAQLFETDAKTLPKRLKTVAPKRVLKGHKMYSIREAAAFIVRPGYEIEEFIRQMSPQELPPLLLKEFWNGQKARLAFEKELGNLWPTEQIVEVVGELENTLRMALLLVTDGVEREEGVTDGQREIIKRMMDGAIETVRTTIEDRFKDYHANRQASPSTFARRADDDDDGNILAAEDDEEEDDGI